MSSDDNWAEMRRLEEMDAALSTHHQDLDTNIKNILKPKHLTRPTSGLKSNREPVRAARPVEQELLDVDSLDDESHTQADTAPSSSRSARKSAPPSPSEPDASKAPDTAVRLQKARIKMLSKQVEESKEMRKQLMEQLHDVQRQLTSERDENKKLKKRVQLLEVDQRRAATPRRMSEAGAASDNTDLKAENAQLKKDLQTAERLVKQAEAASKNKDIQLKRALEAIHKYKQQLESAQNDAAGGASEDRVKLDELRSKNRQLEKQKEELIEGMKLQMKLIDVLKRQKVHLEASRLLSFTEEEFVKTLDWNV